MNIKVDLLCTTTSRHPKGVIRSENDVEENLSSLVTYYSSLSKVEHLVCVVHNGAACTPHKQRDDEIFSDLSHRPATNIICYEHKQRRAPFVMRLDNIT